MGDRNNRIAEQVIWELAQLNIARMRFNLDHPAMNDFVAGLDPLNALADGADGFIWRLQSDEGNATGFSIYNDPSFIVNMSVCESLASLMKFVRSDAHQTIMKRRREWFERPEKPYLVLWWVPHGHRPGVEEAQQRLDHLREHGASQTAFSIRDHFPMPETEAI